jgi:hypothetical protein
VCNKVQPSCVTPGFYGTDLFCLSVLCYSSTFSVNVFYFICFIYPYSSLSNHSLLRFPSFPILFSKTHKPRPLLQLMIFYQYFLHDIFVLQSSIIIFIYISIHHSSPWHHSLPSHLCYVCKPNLVSVLWPRKIQVVPSLDI